MVSCKISPSAKNDFILDSQNKVVSWSKKDTIRPSIEIYIQVNKASSEIFQLDFEDLRKYLRNSFPLIPMVGFPFFMLVTYISKQIFDTLGPSSLGEIFAPQWLALDLGLVLLAIYTSVMVQDQYSNPYEKRIYYDTDGSTRTEKNEFEVSNHFLSELSPRGISTTKHTFPFIVPLIFLPFLRYIYWFLALVFLGIGGLAIFAGSLAFAVGAVYLFGTLLLTLVVMGMLYIQLTLIQGIVLPAIYWILVGLILYALSTSIYIYKILTDREQKHRKIDDILRTSGKADLTKKNHRKRVVHIAAMSSTSPYIITSTFGGSIYVWEEENLLYILQNGPNSIKNLVYCHPHLLVQTRRSVYESVHVWDLSGEPEYLGIIKSKGDDLDLVILRGYGGSASIREMEIWKDQIVFHIGSRAINQYTPFLVDAIQYGRVSLQPYEFADVHYFEQIIADENTLTTCSPYKYQENYAEIIPWEIKDGLLRPVNILKLPVIKSQSQWPKTLYRSGDSIFMQRLDTIKKFQIASYLQEVASITLKDRPRKIAVHGNYVYALLSSVRHEGVDREFVRIAKMSKESLHIEDTWFLEKGGSAGTMRVIADVLYVSIGKELLALQLD